MSAPTLQISINEIAKLDRKLEDYKVKCKCGHTMYVIKDYEICRYCGKKVYKDKKTEFMDKMKGLIK